MFVVFSDIDGTLLDHATYSVEAARGALARLKERGIPLVLCSSKTRAEIEQLQQMLGTSHPFISENGGAAFVPAGYFARPPEGARRAGAYEIVELGMPYEQVVAALRRAAEKGGLRIVSFADLSAEQVAGDTGLSLEDARLAKRREYDEPFRIEGPAEHVPRLVEAMASEGLRHTAGGRYHHASGRTDKGRAVALLSRCFAREHGEITTVGLGDGPNDVPLLRAVNIPIVISNPASGRTGEVLRQVPGARATSRPGPAGWHEAITGLLGPRP